MTLTTRNYYLAAGTLLSFLALTALVFFARKCFPFFTEAAAEAVKRPLMPYYFQKFPSHPYAAFFTAAASVFYAVLAQCFIFRSFEKTQSPEILFFALFSFSFTFEWGRLMIPLKAYYQFPHFFITGTERFEIFGHCFGLFSLFVSSVYASGLKTQRHGTILFTVFLAALMIAIKIPVDPLSWDTTLRPVSGFRSMFIIMDAVFALLTIAGFFVAVQTRGNKEFQLAGLGIFLALLGRFFLLNSDTFWLPIPALLILLAGTWLTIRQLRKLYLWV